ncbi:MAG: cysteine desulfurase family protein [Oscillospiraceae bacterium]
MIYLDNAATTKPCVECRNAVEEAMENTFGNASSLHGLGTSSMQTISRAKRTLLSAVGKSPFEGDVLFVSGATEANNTALLGTADIYSRNGKKIVSTSVEHPSVARVLDKLEERGFEVVRLSPKDFGNFSEGIADFVDEDTFLVSCMAVNNETGFKTDVAELYKKIKKKNSKTIVHIDAVQGFLKMPLDGDLISVSGHKVHATKGIGALFVKKGIRLPALLAGGGQQGGLRSGTEPVELIAGFDAAVRAYRGSSEEFAKLKNHLLDRLARLEDIAINSDEKCVPNIVNFSVRGVRSEIMLHSLEEEQIYVSSGSACSKGKKSGVLSAFGISDKDADSAIRVSFSSESTADDIDRLCEKVAATIDRVRRKK